MNLREQIAEAIESVCLDATFEGENYSRGFWAGINRAASIAREVHVIGDGQAPVSITEEDARALARHLREEAEEG